jgi:hypothetical protein
LRESSFQIFGDFLRDDIGVGGAGALLEISHGAFSPICSMNQKNDQPKNERECSGWQRDEHQPAHHTKSIKQLAVIFSVDHARMHRAFIHAAAMCVSD